MKRLTALFLALCLCACLTACGQPGGGGDAVTVEDVPVSHDEKYGHVHIEIPVDDLGAMGIVYGDSVTLSFSTGYALADIPYYDGYYVAPEAPLLLGYEGADSLSAAFNYGDDIWLLAGLEPDDTVDITLLESGKYLDTQKAMALEYSDDRADYDSDAAYANFRGVTIGDIAGGVLYRGASPVNDQYGRAAVTDRLARDAGILFDVDLSDSAGEIDEFIAAPDFDSPYFLSLYENGQTVALDMSMHYNCEDFTDALTEGFIAMTEHPGPYLIHCVEGKDRTGFACMVLEALAGADYDEIVRDYMLTYENYYGVTREDDPDTYDAIVTLNVREMVRSLVDDDSVDVTQADLSVYARRYLLDAGMTRDQIDALVSVLTGPGLTEE